MNYIIEKYINNLKKEDILNYANKNNISLTNKETIFIYDYIKTNYKNILNDPNLLDLNLIKSNTSDNTYNFILKLINEYSYILKR